VVHACNPSTQETKGGGLRVPGQPRLHREFKASIGYIVRPCLKKEKEKKRLLQL
jgi:hypothetical protein